MLLLAWGPFGGRDAILRQVSDDEQAPRAGKPELRPAMEEDHLRRVRELLEIVGRVLPVLDGIAKRLETGQIEPEIMRGDATIVRRIRLELCKKADAFLTDTQDLGPRAARSTGEWSVADPKTAPATPVPRPRPRTSRGMVGKKGPDGRGE